MKQNYYIETEEFTMINNGDSYSCLVPYKKHKQIRELTYEPIKIREWENAVYNYETGILTIAEGGVSTSMYIPIGKHQGGSGTSEDWGPQRFCPECHTKLFEDEEGDRVFTRYYNPEIEIYEADYFADEKHWWCPKCKEEVLEPLYRSEDPIDWDKYNWKVAIAKAEQQEGTDKLFAIWDIMKEHHDKAGESELEVRDVSYEDMDGNRVDPIYNSEKGLADADSEIFNLTEYSNEEIYFINYLVGNNHTRGMILRSPKRALDKLEETPMRASLKDYYREILEYVIARGHKHPETCRWMCRTNGWKVRSSFKPKPVPKEKEKEQKKYRIIKAWTKVPVESAEDWELEDRAMTAQTQQVYWY